ncbi:MAG: hypothetical protein IV090_09425 [Candidatus Sericytochromatia bacterium]|nr:hypothetical protein [Candidatus Sericytochromatia bacterium]
MELLHADIPFVVNGLPAYEGAYQKTLEIFKQVKINLFNLFGTRQGEQEIRNYHELVDAFSRLKIASSQAVDPQAILREYQALFSKYIISSETLNTENLFSVQVDVLPSSELGKNIVAPAIFPYSSLLQQHFQRIYLNTVLSVSRGDGKIHKRSKNFHAHNYDTFTTFAQAGSQTSVSFFPPAYYRRFKTRLISSTPGIALFIPNADLLDESVMAEALVYEGVQPGDIVYTPPLWFHSFHHMGAYLNIANGEFFPTLFQERLAHLRPEVFGADGENILSHQQALQHYALTPH